MTTGTWLEEKKVSDFVNALKQNRYLIFAAARSQHRHTQHTHPTTHMPSKKQRAKAAKAEKATEASPRQAQLPGANLSAAQHQRAQLRACERMRKSHSNDTMAANADAYAMGLMHIPRVEHFHRQRTQRHKMRERLQAKLASSDRTPEAR
jgi:hypothetical protein